MKISVVVPAYNEEAGLGASLLSIRRAMTVFERRGWSSELIVCDNNSTDRTAEVARASGAAVVFEALNQIARARNTGASLATGDWLVFVDADSHPNQALFADTADQIARGRCLAGGSTLVFQNAPPALRLVAGGWNAWSHLSRWAAGSFMFCRAAAFREVNGFSLDLYAGEEVDLFRRLKQVARRTGRTVVILHRHPLRTSDRKARLYSWSEMSLFAFKTVVGAGRTLRNADECFAWYDGRR